jgi:hypothetical protein
MDSLTGALCGSTYVNEGFAAQTGDRVAGELYFHEVTAKNSMTTLVNKATRHFDRDIKPVFDGKEDCPFVVPFPRLREDRAQKGFLAEELLVTRSDNSIFLSIMIGQKLSIS